MFLIPRTHYQQQHSNINKFQVYETIFFSELNLGFCQVFQGSNSFNFLRINALLLLTDNRFSCGMAYCHKKLLLNYLFLSTNQNMKLLTSSTSSHKPKVIKFSYLILHNSRTVPQLRTIIFVISRFNSHYSPVPDVPQCHHFKSHGQSLVGPPMRGQNGTHEKGTTSPN